jgi:hypothetical protein
LQFEDDRRKPGTVVKKHPVSVCVVLAVSIALIVVACTITQTHAPGVSINETSVQIYPGTKISSDDQKALDAVLKNFNKSLYQIRTYDRGKLVKTRGSLEDARIDQKLVAEVSKASQKGVSDSTLQLGNPQKFTIGWPNQASANVFTSRASSPPPPPSPSTQPTPSSTELRVSKRLVSLVTPILQKYSR